MAEKIMELNVSSNIWAFIWWLQSRYAQKEIFKWIRKATMLVYNTVIDKTPVDTWLLRQSNRVKFNQNELTWTITNSRYYAIFVHNWTKYQKAQPFYTDSLKENNIRIKRIFEDIWMKFKI